MLPAFETAFSQHGTGKAVRPESNGFSSAPTRCPTAELLAFGDGHDAGAHAESPKDASDLPEHGGGAALLEAAPPEAAPRGDQRPGRRSAAPTPKEAPLRRLRSEAYWEQKAAAALQPARSPWELGVRPRRPCHDEDGGLLRAAEARPAAEGAAGGGAAGSPRSWAGAVSRELRRAVHR
ncbi:unnamed protein product [Prorocentrum cordatum]|uniref:Uncharacterized protein n=1 Tax=Prorocentrum cordatum TaxID=2364126 RepID=A0ABN9W855_9DINO|nr:unnamed protein product [Polarella glacialis]